MTTTARAGATYWVFLCLALINHAGYAASYSVTTSSAYPPDATDLWNPRAADGLFTVMSKAVDYHDTQSYVGGGGKMVVITREGVAAGAVYGSDTSAGGAQADPRLLGLAIEPMADAMAHARRLCTYDGGPYNCSGTFETLASASVSVRHRIVQRGVPNISPELEAILNTLGQVRVRLDYALAANVTNPDNPNASLATASFNLLQDTTVLLARKACASAQVSTGCTSVGAESGTWTQLLERSTVDREVVFTISAGSGVLARTASSDGALIEGQAVADPFLHLDPTWEYAPYFMVEQESLLAPGAWLEVTRIWQQPVPEPATWAMLLAGWGVIAAGLRRRHPIPGTHP